MTVVASRSLRRLAALSAASAVLWLALLPVAQAASETYLYHRLESPDQTLQAWFWVEGGVPRYTLERNGEVVVSPSPLGLVLDDADFTADLRRVSASPVGLIEDHYRLKTGKQSEATYRAFASTIELQNPQGETLSIQFRLSDDGLAWRYEIPGKPGNTRRVTAETTGVRFPSDTRAWLQPKAVARTGWSEVNPSYEENYEQDIAVGTPSPSPNGWIFPALFRSGDSWIALTETGMDGTWPGSNLASDSTGGLYRFRFPQAEEVITGEGLLPQSDGAFHSPWRVLVVGDLATVVDSTLGTDLAEKPSRPDEAFDWVEPGIAAWSWGLLKDESVNFDTQKAFIDHAANLKWDYVLVDVNWDTTIGYQRIAELVDYAAGKGVKLFLWFNSSGDWNLTEYTPKSELLTREDRRAVFSRLQDMGIAGVKVDFFPGDGQSVIQRYLDLFEDAADFELLVNTHGSTLPRGMQRTWPNFLTSEAVKGFEFVTFTQEFADMEATHAAMLPFTRNLFDPMDYTPTTLGEIPGDVNRATSNGFQLALSVLFTSGIQHLVATPEQVAAMRNRAVHGFLRQLPAQWDESEFLSGTPGKDVVIARRSGEHWYVAGINARPETATLSFQPPGLTGWILRDGDTPGEMFVRRLSTPRETASVDVGSGQGFIILYGPHNPLQTDPLEPDNESIAQHAPR